MCFERALMGTLPQKSLYIVSEISEDIEERRKELEQLDKIIEENEEVPSQLTIN